MSCCETLYIVLMFMFKFTQVDLCAIVPYTFCFHLFLFSHTSLNFIEGLHLRISPTRHREMSWLDLLFQCNQIHIKLYRFPPKHLSHYLATQRSVVIFTAGMPDLEDLKLHFATGCSLAERKRHSERE